uniref:Ig-like domain-containing protein n=1 Tax=Amphiprion percula TaxID=161767 RepID=A0A3P8UD82_AMPPE
MQRGNPLVLQGELHQSSFTLEACESPYTHLMPLTLDNSTKRERIFGVHGTITVKEDDDVILDCSFGSTNIEKKAFAWKKDVDQSNEEVFWYSGGDTDPGPEFKGRVSHFPDQLRFGNASIKITKAKTSDSGTYTCYHASVQKEIKSTISLTVGEFFHETLIKLRRCGGES